MESGAPISRSLIAPGTVAPLTSPALATENPAASPLLAPANVSSAAVSRPPSPCSPDQPRAEFSMPSRQKRRRYCSCGWSGERGGRLADDQVISAVAEEIGHISEGRAKAAPGRSAHEGDDGQPRVIYGDVEVDRSGCKRVEVRAGRDVVETGTGRPLLGDVVGSTDDEGIGTPVTGGGGDEGSQSRIGVNRRCRR